ncbi:hypothetical protein PR048_012715 [Dryococelus australis]|uniref:Uncharacterized protein n=1 Tax=Dryococelus australis TaxID=614101 RepID=A0ABQ9HQ67_9NEOP|nr:hypothetical protein PR048_012715 [Dryococelus australis]
MGLKFKLSKLIKASYHAKPEVSTRRASSMLTTANSGHMDGKILNITEPAMFKVSIIKVEINSYISYLPGPCVLSSEVRNPFQNQDICTVSCNSYFRIRGMFMKVGNTVPVTTRIVRNWI